MDYAYYGRNDGTKPTTGVAYYMIDAHIQKIISNAKIQFDDDLSDALKKLKKDALSKIKEMKKSITLLNDRVKTLQKKDKDKAEKAEKEDKEKSDVKKSLSDKGYNVL